jgi:hypothetical protein
MYEKKGAIAEMTIAHSRKFDPLISDETADLGRTD